MNQDSVEIKNAKIISTMLGVEDHGIFSFWLILNYGTFSGQGFGGYCLDNYDKEKKIRVGTAFGCQVIMRILKVVGVEKWEDLVNKYVRIKSNQSEILEIGNIIENKWLNLKNLAKEFGL